MLYSKSAEYGIQAMIYLTEYRSDEPTMVSTISDAYDIPHQYLAKIVQTLVKHRLIKAKRGRNGGLFLGRNPKDIYLHEIVYAIDGPPPENEKCAIGLDLCSDETPCPLHHTWKPIKGAIREMLSSENLLELSKRVTEKRRIMNKK